MHVIFLLHDSLETDYKDLDRREKPPTPAVADNPSNWDFLGKIGETNKGEFMFVSTETFLLFPIRQMIHTSNINF